MMFLLFLLFVNISLQYDLPDETCGYVNVDKENDANVFWWVCSYSKYLSRLVLWIKGTHQRYGDMCEIGPNDFQCGKKTEGKVIDREYSWNERANLLFIDQPVGTGFSYVIKEGGYTTNEKQIAEELLKTLQNVYQKYPTLKSNNLYIFAESYGGKMCAHFAVRLIQAIEDKEIEANFTGIGLGDTWVSPLDCMYSYAPFLKALSHFDENECAKSDEYADQIKVALDKGDFLGATDLWGQQQEYMIDITQLNVYNIMLHHDIPMDNLTHYANNVMKKKFGIIPEWVNWESENVTVFEDLAADFMKDSIEQVNEVVKKGGKVIVYSGQLDLIVDVICTERWFAKLDIYEKWKSAEKKRYMKGDSVAFRKKHENVEFWWIETAGHMVPQDNPVSAHDMINAILSEHY